MQTTTNYNMSKPEYGDAADIAPISGDMDTIDTALHKARTRDADLYDETATYNVGDYCIYADTLYKCKAAGVTGTWDSTKWDATTIADAFEPKGTWELFETITADGTGGVYDRNITGRVSGIFLNMVMQAGTEATVVHTYAGFENITGWQRMGYVSNGINTAERYEQVRFTKDGANLWIGEATSAGAQNVSTLNLYRQVNAFTFNASNINKIRIQASSGNIPTGSTIEIYIKR